MRGTRLSDAQRGRIRKLRAEGWSVRQIAAETGVARGTVGDLVHGDGAFATRTCVQCGGEFTVRLAPEDGRVNTCSERCRYYRARILQNEWRRRAREASR